MGVKSFSSNTTNNLIQKSITEPNEISPKMLKGELVNQETFDLLLDWLGGDNRLEAGKKYERIRRLLIRLFIYRGCFEAEELADETINRVTLKLPDIIENYTGEPELYFYAVANNIHYEWLKRQKKIKDSVPSVDLINRREAEYECLESCLAALPAARRELIVGYYQYEKHEKIALRRKIADRLNVSATALQIRASRIRADLLKCIQSCLEKKV